jgi:16S rRNA processing protein RimM
LNDQLTPFFVTSIRPKNNGFVTIKLEGVNDEESAKKILRKEVYLPDVILPDLEGTQFYDHEVVGFEVIDSEAGKIGKVVTIVDLKSNPLLQVDKDGVEILIPLVTNLVKKVDRKNRILEITSPPGLIDIYLS